MIEYIFDEVDTCEQIGHFDNEYVYDIEIDDETHTFIGNDILVHNSIFVSFEQAVTHCDWKDHIFNKDYLSSLSEKVIILSSRTDLYTDNENILKVVKYPIETLIGDKKHEGLSDFLNLPYDKLLIDGEFVKNWDFNSLVEGGLISESDIIWNWSNEIDFIQGIDKFRYEGYYEQCLIEHAATYGVENKEVFELEKISESVINIAKKKYIMNINHEDGSNYENLSYIFPKGVELIRSSTPLFAREKIVNIVEYLFSNPDTYNIKELLELVKDLRREFELAPIDDITMQSSCSDYSNKVIDDTKLPLEFVSGAHFAVKASAYYNYLLRQNSELQTRYDFIKSGEKIKYYYSKNTDVNPIFAYSRGSFPIEFAPDIDYDTQFEKAILSPINGIIEPLGMPTITKRLSVIMDIFSSFKNNKKK